MVIWVGLVAMAADSPAIDAAQDCVLSLSCDLGGWNEGRMNSGLEIGASFGAAGTAVDVQGTTSLTTEATRLVALATLRSRVDALPPLSVKPKLEQALADAQAMVEMLRHPSGALPISTLNDLLKNLKSALGKYFVDIIEDHTEIPPRDRTGLLLLAEPLEAHVAALQYVANRARLYARDPAQSQIAQLLRRAVLHLADGEGGAYDRDLEEILVTTTACRGTLIKHVEAEKIQKKVDSSLRKLSENGSEQGFSLATATELGDIDIDCNLAWENDDYHALGRDTRGIDLEIEAILARSDWEIDACYQREAERHPELRKDADRTGHTLAVAASFEQDTEDLESWSADVAIERSRKWYPNDIDNEIPTDLVSQTRGAVAELIEHVSALPASAALKTRLLKDLDERGADRALAIGDRQEAVDCLEDFINHVMDAKWDGDISEDIAQALCDAAFSLLPRRTIDVTNLPLRLGFPLADGSATLELERETTSYPTSRLLTHTTSTMRAAYSRDRAAHAQSAYFEREKLRYPWADSKDRSSEEWEVEIENELDFATFSVSVLRRKNAYPHARSKDSVVQEAALSLDFDPPGWDISFEFVDKTTRYVNDAAKPSLHQTTVTLDVEWMTSDWSFDLGISEKTEASHSSSMGAIPTKVTRTVGLSCDGDIADALELSFSCVWAGINCPNDPSKDRTDLVIELRFSLST